jgi:hypothetical protein
MRSRDVSEESATDFTGGLERPIIAFREELGIDKQRMCDVREWPIQRQRTRRIQEDDGPVLRGK